MHVVDGNRGHDCSPEEFERYYRESFDAVYSFVMYRLLDADVAYDVTSEAFLRAARYFDTFDPTRAKFSTWVISIARNCIVDYYRRRRLHVQLDDTPEAALGSDEDCVRDVADSDMIARLLNAIDEDERELVYMKYYMGMRNYEIAQEKDMNPSTVATRLQRALAKMRSAAEGDR